MPHTLYLAPCGAKVGLTSVALGLVRALDNRGVRVAFCKPIGQPHAKSTGPERSTHFVRATTSLRPALPLSLEEAERLISSDRSDELMERVMRDFHESASDADVVVVEGLAHSTDMPLGATLNVQLVRTLSAQVILAGSLAGSPMEEFDERLEVAASQYGGLEGGAVIGCIINRVPDPSKASLAALRDDLASKSRVLERGGFHLIGAIPQNQELTACRTIDIARHLGARVLHEGEIQTRRAKKISLLARTVPNMLHTFQAGSILVTPIDRSDVMMAVALSALKTPMAGLVLTGEFHLDERVWNLCRPGLETGLPVMNVESNSWETATLLGQMSSEVPEDDLERVQLGMDHVARYIDADWIASHSAIPVETRMSPAAFCYRITERARALEKRIILPEGDEPRTIRAAALCAQRHIARCVLLGNPEEIHRVASGLEVELPDNLEILDPTLIRANYVGPLVEMRKNKGLTPKDAADLLDDNVWLGTVMLALAEVDGLGFRRGAFHGKHNSSRLADHQDQARRKGGLVDFLHVPARSGSGLRRLRGESRPGRGNAR